MRAFTTSILFLVVELCFAQSPDWYVPVNFNEKKEGVWSDNRIDDFIIFKGELYVGGRFQTLNGTRCFNVAKLVGSSWVPVGKEKDFLECRTFEIYHGELYAGGSFGTFGGVKKLVGNSWEPFAMEENQFGESSTVFDGHRGGLMDVRALKVYRDELYACGENAPNGSPLLFMKWNGSQWSSDGQGLPKYFGLPISLEVFQDELYIAGKYAWDGGFHPFLKWDGKNYTRVEIKEPHKDRNGLWSVTRMETLGNELYISFNDEGLYKYDGKECSMAVPEKTVKSFVVFNNKLYFTASMRDTLITYDDNGNPQYLDVPLDGWYPHIIVFNGKIYGGKMIKN